MKRVMVDIETLSTANDALVLSIAAVEFDLFEEGPQFQRDLMIIPDMVTQIMAGRHVDKKTQEFWAKQPPEASAHWKIPDHKKVSVYDAMILLSRFLTYTDEVWANGITFDIVILESLFAMASVDVPWKYNAARDARTIYKVCPVLRTADPDQTLQIMGLRAHHPLDDCLRQVWSLWANWPGKLARWNNAVDAA